MIPRPFPVLTARAYAFERCPAGLREGRRAGRALPPLGRAGRPLAARGRCLRRRRLAPDHRDRGLHRLFDGAQLVDFSRGAEGDGTAVTSGTRGATDAVDIVVRHVRQVIVIDMRDLGDIQPARGDIGRNQHLRLTLAEGLQRAFTLTLAFVAVDRGDRKAPLFQQPRQLVRTMLGAAKDDRQFADMFRQIFGQQRRLVALTDEMHALVDLFRGLTRRVHGDPDRIGQIGRGQFLHQLRHGGRKQQCLALFRQHLRDPAQRVDKADVQHLVGLVQHQIGGLAQVNGTALDQVDQAAGRGDQHIHAARQPLGLDVDRGTAHHAIGPDRRAFGIGFDIGGDLRRQFPRRRKDQRAAGLGVGLLAVFDQPGQHRQPESCGLAGAGLGKAHHVAAFDHGGDALLLNRRRPGQAHGGNIGVDAMVDPHIRERPGGQRFARRCVASGIGREMRLGRARGIAVTETAGTFIVIHNVFSFRHPRIGCRIGPR